MGYKLCYDALGAKYEYDIEISPQEQMKVLGYECSGFKQYELIDCWVFSVKELVQPLPMYLEIIGEDVERE